MRIMNIYYQYNSRYSGYYIIIDGENTDSVIAYNLDMGRAEFQNKMIKHFKAFRGDEHGQIYFREEEDILKAIDWIKNRNTQPLVEPSTKEVKKQIKRKVFMLDKLSS